MIFNIDRNWYVGPGKPSADQNDLFSVALHEFGHCIGLDNGAEGSRAVMQEKLNQ
jgi:hypothetical protein